MLLKHNERDKSLNTVNVTNNKFCCDLLFSRLSGSAWEPVQNGAVFTHWASDMYSVTVWIYHVLL